MILCSSWYWYVYLLFYVQYSWWSRFQDFAKFAIAGAVNSICKLLGFGNNPKQLFQTKHMASICDTHVLAHPSHEDTHMGFKW